MRRAVRCRRGVGGQPPKGGRHDRARREPGIADRGPAPGRSDRDRGYLLATIESTRAHHATHKPPARLRVRKGAGRTDRASEGRLAGSDPQGAGRQRARRSRGSRHAPSSQGHGRPQRDHGQDNGPGIPADVVEDILDFSVRVSSREAYVSPTRGAQGNALKTIVAMPFVLDGHRGLIEIEAHQRSPCDRLRRRPYPPAARPSSTASSPAMSQPEPGSRSTGPIQLAQSLKVPGLSFYKSPASMPG